MKPDVIIVAFRGTEPFDAYTICTDVDISWYNFKGIGKVHGGFMKALGLQRGGNWPQQVQQNHHNHLAYYTIREMLRKYFMMNKGTKFILTVTV